MSSVTEPLARDANVYVQYDVNRVPHVLIHSVRGTRVERARAQSGDGVEDGYTSAKNFFTSINKVNDSLSKLALGEGVFEYRPVNNFVVSRLGSISYGLDIHRGPW